MTLDRRLTRPRNTPRPSIVAPEARASQRARTARAGPDSSKRCAASTASTSALVFRATHRQPIATSCGAMGAVGVVNCGKKAMKNSAVLTFSASTTMPSRSARAAPCAAKCGMAPETSRRSKMRSPR
jgi:hypothetical protein